MATNIDKDTLTYSISELITLKVLIIKNNPNDYDYLYLNSVNQIEIDLTLETRPHEIDDDPVKSTTAPSTSKRNT